MLMKHYEQSSISYFFMLYRAHHTDILFCVTLPVSSSPLPYQDCTFRCLFTEVLHPTHSKLLLTIHSPLLFFFSSHPLHCLFCSWAKFDETPIMQAWVSLPHESRTLVLPFCVANGQNSCVAFMWWRIDEAGWKNKLCYKSGLLRR